VFWPATPIFVTISAVASYVNAFYFLEKRAKKRAGEQKKKNVESSIPREGKEGV
jgi:hypothetical protein